MLGQENPVRTVYTAIVPEDESIVDYVLGFAQKYSLPLDAALSVNGGEYWYGCDFSTDPAHSKIFDLEEKLAVGDDRALRRACKIIQRDDVVVIASEQADIEAFKRNFQNTVLGQIEFVHLD